MYDSTNPHDIPADAAMVAYYVDGYYTWPQQWIDLFPNAVKVTISAIGVKTAMVGDVEVGCIWPPSNAVDWVRRARAAGIDPTIYVNERNDWEPTLRAFIDAGEPEPHWWVANYDGVQKIPAGAVAKQFAHPPMLNNRHYDLSVVADYWPGVDNPTEQEEDSMANFTEADKQKLLDAAEKLTHAFRVTDDTRPLALDVADDAVGHLLSERARLEQFIEGWRIMNSAVANIETVVNAIKARVDALTAAEGGGVVAAGPVDISDASVVKVREATVDEIEGRQRTRLRADLAELENDQHGL
jgi:hypothetical protein